MNNLWDERYAHKEYFYGEEPNVFFAEQLKNLKQGKIILPCEGEGRNAVYASLCGWEVEAFDSSEGGKIKAIQLASSKGLTINYILEDAIVINYPENSFEVVAFIFAHFPVTIRKQIHHKAISWLKPGGKIIIEAFNPKQFPNSSGVPKDLSMLYTEDVLRNDFYDLNIELLQLQSTVLKEGKHHEGLAEVIRFVGVKK